MADHLRNPAVHVRTDPGADPTIRLSLFTLRGTERGTDLTADQAVALAHDLLSCVRSQRRAILSREEAEARAAARARLEVESRG